MKKSAIRNVVILHGWKVPTQKYSELSSIFKSCGYAVYTPDLPGFGSHKGSKKVLEMDDYSSFLEHYLKTKRLNNCVLVGHSYGSRVIVHFLINNRNAERNFDIKGIVLSGAPLMRSRLSVRKLAGIMLSKTGKKIVKLFPSLDTHSEVLRKILYIIVGEWDYFNAGDMRQTFINVVKTDLQDTLGDIHIPTLLLWGREDRVTPYKDALEIKKRIHSSTIVSIPGASHKLPYEKPDLFAKEVIRFVESL